MKVILSGLNLDIDTIQDLRNFIQKVSADLDLDHFVTDRALEGVFRLLAKEEQKIRTDPLARTTDLLRSVFGG